MVSQIFIFLFGLAVGSFLNCVIYRMERGGGFLNGRSYCPHCKHKLEFRDLIPVLSFLWLKARCRYCHGKISRQYPLVELAAGILFVFIILRITTMVSILSFYWWAIICFLIIIFVYDLKHYIIPDKIIFPAIGTALIYNLSASCLTLNVTQACVTFNVKQYLDFIISAFGAAAFFLAIVLISRGKWMGAGDIKLAFLMGLLLGFPNILVALFLAFFIGAIIGVGLIILGKKNMKSEMPFGPFLVGGTFIALFLGKEIINWYVQILYPVTNLW